MKSTAAEILDYVGGRFTEDDCPDMEAARIFGPSQSKASFRQVGLKSFSNLIDLAGLQPDEQVLDIGCGIGRVALPLTYYLSDKSRYFGIDPVANAVNWCQENISSQHGNFEFSYVDWSNRMYNPKGTVDPTTYTFPWPDGKFDLIYLFSVFTHVLPDTLVNYLCEIKRMLTPEGRVLMTMLLVDEDTRPQLENGHANRPYFRVNDIYWTDHEKIHESAVCYEYDYVQKLLGHIRLSIRKPFVRGGWRSSQAGQDIFVVYNK